VVVQAESDARAAAARQAKMSLSIERIDPRKAKILPHTDGRRSSQTERRRADDVTAHT
jgi:hypothetical protein